jgi:hypothetical protein
MDNLNKKSIFFYTACIFDFAEKYKISLKESYIYLNKYNGIQYLIENYDIEHTLSKEDTLEALLYITSKNGGYLI